MSNHVLGWLLLLLLLFLFLFVSLCVCVQYDPKDSPMNNVNLPDSLLSRFDLLFIVLDTVDPEIVRGATCSPSPLPVGSQRIRSRGA